jgi:hypothetical protein
MREDRRSYVRYMGHGEEFFELKHGRVYAVVSDSYSRWMIAEGTLRGITFKKSNGVYTEQSPMGPDDTDDYLDRLGVNK